MPLESERRMRSLEKILYIKRLSIQANTIPLNGAKLVVLAMLT